MHERARLADTLEGVQPLSMEAARQLSVESEQLFAVAFLFLCNSPLYHEPVRLEAKIKHRGRSSVAHTVPDFLCIAPSGKEFLLEVTTLHHADSHKRLQRKIALAAGWKHRYIRVNGSVISRLRPLFDDILRLIDPEKQQSAQLKRETENQVYCLLSPLFAGQFPLLMLGKSATRTSISAGRN